MPGGTTETHRDSDYSATGSHKFGTSTTLTHPGADFKSCGVRVGVFIENVTQSTSSHIATVTEDQITTDDSLSWAYGDVYRIYKTATKDSFISSQWCDLSRGWKTPQRDLVEGWRAEDMDLDRDNPGRVFGPNQPERKRGR
jgi:hypothetical protein